MPNHMDRSNVEITIDPDATMAEHPAKTRSDEITIDPVTAMVPAKKKSEKRGADAPREYKDGMNPCKEAVAEALGACPCCGRFGDCEADITSRLRKKLEDRRQLLTECGERPCVECSSDPAGGGPCQTHKQEANERRSIDQLIEWINDGDCAKTSSKQKIKKRKKRDQRPRNQLAINDDEPVAFEISQGNPEPIQELAPYRNACSKRVPAPDVRVPDDGYPAHHQNCKERASLGRHDECADTDDEVEVFRDALEFGRLAHCGCRMTLTPQIHSRIVDMCAKLNVARRY